MVCLILRQSRRYAFRKLQPIPNGGMHHAAASFLPAAAGPLHSSRNSEAGRAREGPRPRMGTPAAATPTKGSTREYNGKHQLRT